LKTHSELNLYTNHTEHLTNNLKSAHVHSNSKIHNKSLYWNNAENGMLIC